MDSITPAKITDTLPVPIAPLNTFNPRGNVILSYLDRKISGFKKSFHEARKVSKEVIIMTDFIAVRYCQHILPDKKDIKRADDRR